MRAIAVCWMLVFASALSSAPAPKRLIDPNLIGRWRMVGISFDLSKSPIQPSCLPEGMDLIYVFRDNGLLELRNEFSYTAPVVRLGGYEVSRFEVRHTATWARDRGKILTMQIESLSPSRLVLTQDGITREFVRVEIAPPPRMVVSK